MADPVEEAVQFSSGTSRSSRRAGTLAGTLALAVYKRSATPKDSKKRAVYFADPQSFDSLSLSSDMRNLSGLQ